MSKELDFSLIAWIKKDQAERAEHQSKMAVKYASEDELYLKQIREMFEDSVLKEREAIFCINMLSHKKKGYNFSSAQKSAINNLFYKKYY